MALIDLYKKEIIIYNIYDAKTIKEILDKYLKEGYTVKIY